MKRYRRLWPVFLLAAPLYGQEPGMAHLALITRFEGALYAPKFMPKFVPLAPLGETGKGKAILEAPPAEVEDQALLEQGLVQEWKASLARLGYTEHAAYLEKFKTPFLFKSNGKGILSSQLAKHEEEGIYINREIFSQLAAQLESQGVPREEVSQTLARKTFSVIVHEISHGLMDEELCMEFPAGCVEEETLGMREQVLAQKKIQAEHPTLWENGKYALAGVDTINKTLMDAWDRQGLLGLEDYVRRVYEVVSLKGSKREDLKEDFQKKKKFLESALTFVRELKEDEKEGLPSEGMLSEALGKANKVLKVLDDPDQFEKLKNYYEKKLGSLNG